MKIIAKNRATPRNKKNVCVCVCVRERERERERLRVRGILGEEKEGPPWLRQRERSRVRKRA